MKNQYVGDINDYRKYDLLQILSRILGQRLLVVWMLTENDNQNDGKKTKYLNYPEKWRKYNEKLFDELKKIVAGKKRCIEQVQELPLFKENNFIFYSEYINDELTERDNYFKNVIKASHDAKILFFDPDNGIEPTNTNKIKKPSKYLFWKEIEKFWNLEKDILIFQYFPWFCNRENYIKNKIEKCSKMMKIDKENIIHFFAKNVFYLFLTHDISNKRVALNKEWKKWI
jgi:hypothetical protein